MGLWLALCSAATFVSVGDEGIYLYDGWLVAQGHVPYRDFFLAHPPLRVLLSAGLFQLGLPAVAGKWLAILATASNTALVAALARRGAGSTASPQASAIAGAIAGGVAALLWITASLSLETGFFYLGSNLATTFMLGACLAAAYGRFAWSGAILGLGAHQALYAILPGPTLLWWAWKQGRAKRFLLGGMTWPGGVLLAWLLFGDAYLVQTIAYHLRKVGGATKPWPVHRIVGFLRADWAAVTFALAAWLAKDTKARFIAALAWQSLLVVCLYRSLQGYYFILPLALLCAAGGVGVVHLWRRVAERTPSQMPNSQTPNSQTPTSQTPTSPRQLTPALGLVALGLLIMISLSAIPNVHAALRRRAFQPVIEAELSQLTALVKSKKPASGLLWGDTSVTATLALRTGLTIAQHDVDTNDQRYESGLRTAEKVITEVLTGDPPGVLMVPHHGIYRVLGVRTFVERHFLAQFVFQGRAMGYEVVYLLPAKR